MKSNFFSSKIGGALLGVSLLFGIGVTSSLTAQAQDDRHNDNYNNGQNGDDHNRGGNHRRWGRNDDGYGNYGGSVELRRTALNEGFNAGLKDGRNDYKHGEYSNYTDEKEFQKGTKSYNSRLGDREVYRRYFREAFSHGYSDGYAGY